MLNLTDLGRGFTDFLTRLKLGTIRSSADNNVYTVHELANTVTHQIIPAIPGNDFPTVLANLSTLPAQVPAGSVFGAGELLLLPVTGTTINTTQRYLLASNRNTSNNLDPKGDSIAIFSTQPELKLVNQVYTGLNQIRGMMVSPCGKYVIAAGLVGGGIAVFEVTEGGANMALLARYTGTGSVEVSSFVWLE